MSHLEPQIPGLRQVMSVSVRKEPSLHLWAKKIPPASMSQTPNYRNLFVSVFSQTANALHFVDLLGAF